MACIRSRTKAGICTQGLGKIDDVMGLGSTRKGLRGILTRFVEVHLMCASGGQGERDEHTHGFCVVDIIRL